MSESKVFAALVGIVVEDADATCRRVQDKATNAARAVVLEAQDRYDELTRAARELGRVRGMAAEAAEAQAASREVAGVEAGAFDALFERFARRVLMGAKALPESPRYPAALQAWAAASVSALDAPAEVFTSKRDRAAVYAALLAAGAEDFHVRVEHRIHVGFVARDLEGRTLYDCRPDALVERHTEALRSLLEAAVPPPPAFPLEEAPGEPTEAGAS